MFLIASLSCNSRFPKFLRLPLPVPFAESSSSLEFCDESGGEKIAPVGSIDNPPSTGAGDLWMLPLDKESLCLWWDSGREGRNWVLIGGPWGEEPDARRFLYRYVADRGGLFDFITVEENDVAGDLASYADAEVGLALAGDAAGDWPGGV
jgi:hypothetical protein